MKIAQFKTGIQTLNYCDEDIGKIMEGTWVRLTEYLDVTFIPLPSDEVVAKQLRQLDDAEKELRLQFQGKMNELVDARSKLLSLTHEVSQ